MTCMTGRFSRIVAFVAVLFAASGVNAETYIVPIWSTSLRGSDGTWWAQATATNPNPFPVSLRVSRVFPMRTRECNACSAALPEITLEPYASRTITPPAGIDGRRLEAGAFEVTSSAPIGIHVVAYGPGEGEIRQRLDVARRWLAPGVRFISTVERSSLWRVNAFLTNPNDTPLDVSVWTQSRALDEARVTVAPRSTVVVAVPPPNCGSAPCPPDTTEYPPRPIRIQFEAGAEFLASVSSVGDGWAIFSIADEAAY